GYDFGYFIKMLQNSDLEEDDEEFFAKLRLHCPDIYDVKYLMKSCKDLKGGLQEVSDYLQLKRVGPQHQAGSDSLLTGMAFFKMRELYFENNIEREKYSGHLYGLGPFAASTASVTNGSGYGEYDTSADNGTQGSALQSVFFKMAAWRYSVLLEMVSRLISPPEITNKLLTE
ncbi:CCR4-NOT transcription complex subunit 7, partial [Bulinus truncatus]